MSVPVISQPSRGSIASRQNSGPLVSVIVPSYNGSRTIRRALESLMAQDIGSPYEVIVVDSSSDGTDSVVRQEFSWVQLMRRDTKTPTGAARNLGVAQGRGDIIAFMDQDCVADRSWLRRLVAAHGSNVAGVGGSVANGNPRSLVGWASFLMEFARFAPSSPRRPVSDIVGCNSSYKRWVFEKYGFHHDGHFTGEDAEFNRRLLEGGERLLFEPGAVVWHLNREGMGDFLRHMRYVGESVGLLRLLSGMPHSYLARRWWLAAAVLPYRVGRIAARGLRWHLRDAWRLPAVLPLLTAGFVAFSIGEMGARRSRVRTEARAALADAVQARARSDS